MDCQTLNHYTASPTPPAASTTGMMITDDWRQWRRTSIKRTAIAHIVNGALLVLFGTIAICVKAAFAYFAIPIWTGLVIFGLTGLLGRYTATKDSRAASGGYIGMSIVSFVVATVIVVNYIFAAVGEVGYLTCLPRGWHAEEYCSIRPAVRVAINSIIVVIAFAEFALSFCSAYYGCFYACPCCETCCDECCCCCDSHTPPSTTAVSTINGTMIPTDTGGVPVGGAVMFQGNPQMLDYPQPGMYVVQQAASPQGYSMSGQLQQVAGGQQTAVFQGYQMNVYQMNGQQVGDFNVHLCQQSGGPYNPAPAEQLPPQQQQQQQQSALTVQLGQRPCGL